MSIVSSSKMQAALSPNQKLVAVLPPSATGASKSPTQRWTLPLYSVASRSLQATLTWNPSTESKVAEESFSETTNALSPWQRLVFFNDDHVAGLFQHRHIVVWNVPRGIVSYTVDLLKGKKEQDDKLILLDVVTPLITTTAVTSNATSSPFFYALVQKESKLYVYEYNIETGKLQRKIKCGHADQQQQQSSHSTLSLAVVITLSSNGDTPPEGRIFLTTGRRQVKVISLSNGQKVSKMKLAADTSGSMTALTSDGIAATAVFVVVGIPTASGVVIAKLVLGDDKEELTAVATLPIKLEDSTDQQQPQGALQMWLKTTTSTSTATTPTKTKSSSPTVDLILLLNQTDLYEYANINSSSSSSKTAAPSSLQPSCRLERDLSTKQEDQQHVVLAMSNASLWHQVVAVLYRRGQGVVIKSIPLVQNADDASTSATYRDKITLSYQEDGTADETNKDEEGAAAGKKRKQSQNVATTLGPGQAGHELVKVSDRPTKKQAKKQDEEATETPGDEGDAAASAAAGTSSSSLTIAERLQQLAALAEEDDDDEDDDDEDAMDTSGDGKDDNKQPQVKFVPKQATTQSLTHLLQQACASNDDGLLELALSVRDVRVIEQSMYELAQQQQQQQEAAVAEGDPSKIKWMDVLLTRLITRLANKPQRAEALSLWIQCWLKQHQQWEAETSSTTSWQSVQGLLQPLRNLLQERVQTFSLWLQLEGRLSMMKS